MGKPKAGQVAIQQALIKYFGLTYDMASKVMRVNARTLWQHVAANKGSNVAAWEDRPEDIKEAAIVEAQKAINAYALRHRGEGE
jgi:hypothetical protein